MRVVAATAADHVRVGWGTTVLRWLLMRWRRRTSALGHTPLLTIVVVAAGIVVVVIALPFLVVESALLVMWRLVIAVALVV